MSPRLRSFRLAGDLFQELVSPAGIFSPELGLELVVVGHELRFRKPGRVKFLPTARVRSRRAQKEKRRADREAQRAESEAQRADEALRLAERMAEKLRALGVDPESLTQ